MIIFLLRSGGSSTVEHLLLNSPCMHILQVLVYVVAARQRNVLSYPHWYLSHRQILPYNPDFELDISSKGTKREQKGRQKTKKLNLAAGQESATKSSSSSKSVGTIRTILAPDIEMVELCIIIIHGLHLNRF